jgi:UDP:flavonoid glycosyltransferase YjiC (YdhE family)
MGHVLVSTLNWGLGHATRDIPVIKNLLDHHHDVTVAACGNALSVLEKEFPECRCIEFPDYPIPYSASRFFLPKFVAFFPLMLKAVSDERKNLDSLLSKNHYDLIISDNRLGFYSSKIPSIFITHQLHYHLPMIFWPVELLAVETNGYLHGKYRHIIVPDNPSGPTSLAGKLSRPETNETKKRVFYSGILTSTRKREVEQDLDYLVMISGPEPQRTKLEEILVRQIHEMDENCVILLGSPRNTEIQKQSGNCRVIAYASTQEKEKLMNRAKFIICRSGYTSIMEIAELEKQRALFIPTPGQTEQEYLSWYYEKKGWFHSQSQYRLDLPEDIRHAQQPRYTGFPVVQRTSENVERVYDQVLSQYLD